MNNIELAGQKKTIRFQKLTIFLSLLMVNFLFASQITLGLTGVTLKEDISTIMNFKEYLAKHTKIDLNLKFAKSYSIMESFIINKTVDFAYICGATYVNLEKTNKVELLVIPVFNHQAKYSSLIITKKNSSYKSLFELKDKTFAMSDPDSNSGSLVPFYELLKKGYSKDDFFKKVIYTYDHGESIQAVLSGFVEAASVDSMVYEAYINKNPSAKEKLNVINNFSDYPIPPFIIRKDMNKKTKDILQTTLLKMHNDDFGKKILSSMSIDYFIKPENISYKKIEKIKNFIEKSRVKDDK